MISSRNTSNTVVICAIWNHSSDVATRSGRIDTITSTTSIFARLQLRLFSFPLFLPLPPCKVNPDDHISRPSAYFNFRLPKPDGMKITPLDCGQISIGSAWLSHLFSSSKMTIATSRDGEKEKRDRRNELAGEREDGSLAPSQLNYLLSCLLHSLGSSKLNVREPLMRVRLYFAMNDLMKLLLACPEAFA